MCVTVVFELQLVAAKLVQCGLRQGLEFSWAA